MLDEVSSSNKNPPALAVGSVNTTEHPAWYYQQKDITDPTPYEYEPKRWGDLECTMCGYQIFRGEQKTARNPLSLDMGSRAENRGTHGDSSFMLNEESLSSENPPAFSRGECQDLVRTIVMHKDCFPLWLKEDPHMWESIKRFMELLDFEIEEGEIP